MKQIKAINTFYNGYHFRSRLEARWAVFFDAMGIKYEYEPEGYVLPNGECYLPDFVLYDLDGNRGIHEKVFVEVKNGKSLSDAEANKIWLFANQQVDENSNFLGVEHRVLVLGDIRDYLNCDALEEKWVNNVPFHSFRLIDGADKSAFFWICELGSSSFGGVDSRRLFNLEKIALKLACAARFEHGQTPNTNDIRAQFVEEVKKIRLPFLFLQKRNLENALSESDDFRGRVLTSEYDWRVIDVLRDLETSILGHLHDVEAEIGHIKKLK